MRIVSQMCPNYRMILLAATSSDIIEFQMDTNVEITLKAYQQIFQQYSDRNATIPEQVKEMLDRFLAKIPGRSILDVGCAHGRESKYLFNKGCEVTGVDLSADFVRIAKKNCPKGKFLVQDMRKLQFAANSFDGIWCQAAFLHVPKTDAAQTLQGFYEVLKPNGLLYLSVMKGDFDDLRANPQTNWPDRHFSDYQPEELGKLLKAAGFTDITCEANEVAWGPTFLHFFGRKL